MGKVPLIIDEASPEIYDEELGSCPGMVEADLLSVSNFSVPVLPDLLLIIRLGPVCWDVFADPAVGVVTPWDMTLVLDAARVVGNPEPK